MNPTIFRFKRKLYQVKRINRRLIALVIALLVLQILSVAGFIYLYNQKKVIIFPKTTKIYSSSSFTFHERYIQQKTIALFIDVNNPKLNSYEIEKLSVNIMDASLKFNVHPYTIASLIKIESNFNKDAISSAQCIGLMQLNHRVHLKNFISNFKDIRNLSDLKNPRNNIMAGTWLFKMMIEASNGKIDGALTKYLGASSFSYRLKYRENLQILREIEDSIKREWRF